MKAQRFLVTEPRNQLPSHGVGTHSTHSSKLWKKNVKSNDVQCMMDREAYMSWKNSTSSSLRGPPCHHCLPRPPPLLYVPEKLTRNQDAVGTSTPLTKHSDCQCLGFLHHWKGRASHKRNHIDLCKPWHRTQTSQRRTANSPTARINCNLPQLQTAPKPDIREAGNASSVSREREGGSRLYKWFGCEGNELCT